MSYLKAHSQFTATRTLGVASGVDTLPLSDTVRDDLRAEVVTLIVESLAFVLRRQRESYPFIDTKYSLVTGQDFAADDQLRGPDVVYTWIQGRGLEALVKHANWLRKETSIKPKLRDELLAIIDSLIPRVAASMERIRAVCGGHVPFMVDHDGRELTVNDQGLVVPATEPAAKAASFGDLFYCKGLIAAATYMNDPVMTQAAIDLFATTVADIRSGRFTAGQVALDPKNPVRPVPGRFSHASRMIAIGAATLFFEMTKKQEYADLGNEFIEHVLSGHCLTSATGDGSATSKYNSALMEGDLWEFVDAEGKPWLTPAGQIWSDPGHSTEYVGLSLAHMAAIGAGSDELRCRLRQVLSRSFANGFSGMGMVKAYDLARRSVINGDMPWWSLPETMRAAALVAVMCDPSAKVEAESIFVQTWNAFTKWYVKPEVGFCSVQCLEENGSVATAIPATPDADPGYHTGLSLLGCLPWLDGPRQSVC